PLLGGALVGSRFALHGTAGAAEAAQRLLGQCTTAWRERHGPGAGAVGPDGAEPCGTLPLLVVLAVSSAVRTQGRHAACGLGPQVGGRGRAGELRELLGEPGLGVTA